MRREFGDAGLAPVPGRGRGCGSATVTGKVVLTPAAASNWGEAGKMAVLPVSGS